MLAYKLCRILKSGEITSLFINKTKRLPFNEWLIAENHPTNGFAVRPHWHCTLFPLAPHLSKKDRVWVKVEIENFTTIERPISQGSTWFLADRIKIIEIVNEKN